MSRDDWKNDDVLHLKADNPLVETFGQSFPSKPEVVEDSYHMFGERLRPVPVSLNADFFRDEGNDYLSSKTKGLQIVCQLNEEMYANCLSTKLFDIGSSFLIDDDVGLGSSFLIELMMMLGSFLIDDDVGLGSSFLIDDDVELTVRTIFSVFEHLVSIGVIGVDLRSYEWKPGQYMSPYILEDKDVGKRNGIRVRLALTQDEEIYDVQGEYMDYNYSIFDVICRLFDPRGCYFLLIVYDMCVMVGENSLPCVNVGVMSGTIIFIREELKLTEMQLEVLVGILSIISLFGSLASGRTSDAIGRKWTMGFAAIIFQVGFAAIIFQVGAAIMCIASSFEVLMVGGLFAGIGIGFGVMIAPVYIAEISPTASRGTLTSFPEIFINIGILLGYVSNYAFSGLPIHINWRIMFAVGISPLVLTICLLMVGFTLVVVGTRSAAIAMVIISVCGNVAFFSIGKGPVCWILTFEIFPLKFRAQASALASMSNRVCSGLIAMSFLCVSCSDCWEDQFGSLHG